MEKALKRVKKELFIINTDGSKTIVDNENLGDCSELRGDCSELSGNCSGLWGDCSGLRGDCSELSGNCSGLWGDCSGLWGDCSECNLTEQEKLDGVNIQSLVCD